VGEGIRSAHFAFRSECKIDLIDLKTVKPEFSDTLDELADVTQQFINNLPQSPLDIRQHIMKNLLVKFGFI
jgi:hypothetical protein